jgi:hypothetical protein
VRRDLTAEQPRDPPPVSGRAPTRETLSQQNRPRRASSRTGRLMALAIDQVLEDLKRADMPIDRRHGENGVATLCLVCPGETIWTEDLQRFVCSRPDCASHRDQSLMVDRVAARQYSQQPEVLSDLERIRAVEAAEPEDEFSFSTPPREVENGKDASGRFTTRRLDTAEFDVLRFAWQQRLVIGVLNLIAGGEAIGKGTLLGKVIAWLTLGELPGDLRGKPTRVLWIGDEDSWTQVVGPRLYAAGADLTRVEELVSTDSRFFDVHRDAAELDRNRHRRRLRRRRVRTTTRQHAVEPRR